MGTMQYYPGTYRTFAEAAMDEMTGSTDGQGPNYQVVTRSGRYYAVRVPEGNVIGVVALGGNRRDGIWVKLVDESMGPSERNCPKKVLDALTDPAPNEWAEEWRARCRANLANPTPTLKPGDIVRFIGGIRFDSGARPELFRFKGRFSFDALDSDGHVWFACRLPKDWKRAYNWNMA